MSRSLFTQSFINEKMLKGYQGRLKHEQSDVTLMYKRRIEGKSTQYDLDRIKELNCPSCEEGAWKSMKWAYEQRDYNIALYSAYVEMFQNKVNVDKGTELPFEFIKTKYGESSYNWIIKNKVRLDKVVDAYIEKERVSIREGKFYFNWNYEDQVVPTYEIYVFYIWWQKLENYKTKANSNLLKAVYEYFQYRLLSDERLYITK